MGEKRIPLITKLSVAKRDWIPDVYGTKSKYNSRNDHKYKNDMAWVPDVMRNQELEKVLEVSNKIEIN